MVQRHQRIDEFESMFRKAHREPFTWVDVPIQSVTVIADGSGTQASAQVRSLRDSAPRLNQAEWRTIPGDAYSNVAELLALIETEPPDLLVTWRHLQEESLIPQHSLGVYLDVLTQATAIPVLVLPGTSAEPAPLSSDGFRRVMVVTDHISGDNRLINYGVRMCTPGGSIWLCHIEDDQVFGRYARAIERIPELDTEQTVRLLREQLVKDARDFIQTSIATLQSVEAPNVMLHSHVDYGHHLSEYRELVDQHRIDLLVTNTKDEDQMAMHGLAYSISIEMPDVAMLLL